MTKFSVYGHVLKGYSKSFSYEEDEKDKKPKGKGKRKKMQVRSKTKADDEYERIEKLKELRKRKEAA